MKNSYKRFMEKVTVDKAMEERIIEKINEEPVEIVMDKRFLFLRKLAPVAICLCLILGVFVYRVNIENKGKNGNVGVVNPIVEFSNLDQLRKSVEFKIYVPDSDLIKYKEISYFLLDNKTVEIRYKGEDDLTYRTIKGKENISGDYSNYPYVYEVQVNGFKGKIKGTADGIKLAQLERKGYAFSISSPKGMKREEMLNIIKSIK